MDSFERAIKDGDIVSVDCGVLMNEFYGDVAYTFEVGEVADDIKKLLIVTKHVFKKVLKLQLQGIESEISVMLFKQ